MTERVHLMPKRKGDFAFCSFTTEIAAQCLPGIPTPHADTVDQLVGAALTQEINNDKRNETFRD